MGILDRISTIVKSNVNSMLDKSSNPEADLNYFLVEMQDGIKQVETEIINAMARQKMLEMNANDQRRKAQEWDSKAQQAVKLGRDDLATEALRQKLAADQDAENLDTQLHDQKVSTDQLRANLEELKKKQAEVQQNKGNLIARYNMLKAGEKVMGVKDPLTGMPTSDYTRMQQKVMASEVLAEMGQSEIKGMQAEAELNKMQTEATLEDELAALKSRMGGKPAADKPKTEADKPYDEK